ncbi:hypothetical protein LSH36_649g01031 [Paralvinella palmiformis]|uniref:Sodium/calcium exchanger membrane region domain-containing protein n=1 Tax=Paralvinella palmiformis TaxID=53620 RepID=A0AAD9J4V3_9ANNE|nr:hypothetical protein LSH36_649g01031 [Paralvinella palmiformis]
MVLLAILLPVMLLEVITVSLISGVAEAEMLSRDSVISGRHLLQDVSVLNCTPRSIHQFPDDFMTEVQRKRGGIAFHIFLTLYVFAATAIACDDFFVPSLEKLVEDVAGATFMAAGSSAPEFFAAVIGISFAQSDIGLSTIVGSAVFNLLFVNAICGLFAGMLIKNNEFTLANDTKKPLLAEQILRPGDVISTDMKKTKDNYGIYGTLENSHPGNVEEEQNEYDSLLTSPKGCCKRFIWLMMLPCSFLMVFTIPDFRRGGFWAKLYPLTFFFSIVWIAGLCYVMVWMVTITGTSPMLIERLCALQLQCAKLYALPISGR